MATPRKGRKKRVYGGSRGIPDSKSPQSDSAAPKRGGYHKYQAMNPQRAAAEFLRAKGKLTQQQAADRFGFPRTTLGDVLARAAREGLTADDLDPLKPSNSPISHRVAPLPAKKLRGSGRPPVLTEAEEAGLVNLILKHWAGNLSLNRVQLGVYVMRLLEGRKFPGDAAWRLKGGPSAKWFKGFIRRHKAIISLRKGDPLAHNRREVSKQQIDSFFDVLKEVEDINGGPLRAEQIYNLDETCFMPDGTVSRVLTGRGATHTHTFSAGNRDSVTILPCICADGTSLPPLVIGKGKDMGKPKWAADLADIVRGTAFESAVFVNQESSYMTSE